MSRTVIVRIGKGIHEHFPARASEWVLSFMIVRWGQIVASPDALFDISPAFSQMKLFAPEWAWGYAAMAIGLLRLIALIVNGTFSETRYGRWSPHVRAVISSLSCFFWTQISLGIYYADIGSTGLAVYPGLALLDAWNAVRASGDAGAVDGSRKHGGT